MRILTVGNMYPPHHMGGYELVWQAAMRRARLRGHDVRVLTSDHREPGVEGEEDPDVHRELALYWDWERRVWKTPSPSERLRIERRHRAILHRHLEDLRPDAVSFWAMGAMSLSLVEIVRRSGIPSNLVVHDEWLVYGPARDAWMRLWSRWRAPLRPVAHRVAGIPTRFDRRRRERVIANSEFILRRAREHGYAFDDAGVVSPGVDEAFAGATRPGGDWRWRLLCVGRLDEQKGTDVALAALAQLPEEATLTIAGAGDRAYEAKLRAAAGELGAGRVRFTGPVDRAALRRLYAECDAVVFPVRWEEPFGLVPLEAMAMRRPVVATARGGAVEYLRDGRNALIVAVDDPGGIATAVRTLGTQLRLREELVDEGVRTATLHSSRRFEDAMVDEFEDLK